MSENTQDSQTTATIDTATSLEGRVQSQFNEEKWTRIGAKDVSISRFRILETLIEEIADRQVADAIRESSKEHLTEYEPSIAARYFLGMIALRFNIPDEQIYLKQLLDQFQDYAKWAVVDYLSEKMLAVNDRNLPILRARVRALEKLGRAKDALPILEKLANSSRKDPETFLQYADAIMAEDAEKAILNYKKAAEAFAKNMQLDKLKLVWNRLAELIPEDMNFFRKIERILSGHRQKETLAELFVNLANVYSRKEDIENLIIASKKILEYNPGYARFRNELMRAYREKHKDHSLLEDFLRVSGLKDTKKSIQSAILSFETNIVFDKGNYVFHRSWGVGQIADITNTEMVIDFKDKPAHRMNLEMSLKSLKPLQADHYWVRQYQNPDEIENLLNTDKTAFFKMLLSSFGGRMSLADIKAEVAGRYIPLDSWSRWWTKTRAEILNDPQIGVSPQKKDVIELSENALSQSEKWIEKFQGATDIDEKVSSLMDSLREPEDNRDAIEYAAGYLRDALRGFDLSVRIQALAALEVISSKLPDLDTGVDTATEDKLQEEIARLTVPAAFQLSSELKRLEAKKLFLSLLQRGHSAWRDVFVALLLETPVRVHADLISKLADDEGAKHLDNFIKEVSRPSKGHIEVFLWFFKYVLRNPTLVGDSVFQELLLTFFRLLKTIQKVELKGTKLHNAARDLLIDKGKGTKESVMVYPAIQSRASDSVRKLVALIADVDYLSDVEKDDIRLKLREISPEAFTEDSEPGLKKDSAEDLIAKLEKSGTTVASKNAIASMRAELDHLVNNEIPANSEEIGIAQEKGDLRENAEYKAALERQSMLQAQVTQLEANLKTVALLTSDQIATDTVGLGCRVRLRDTGTGDVFVYSVLDRWDADVDKGIISFKSPLGKALLGHKKGETAVFASGSTETRFEIQSIDKALTADGALV